MHPKFQFACAIVGRLLTSSSRIITPLGIQRALAAAQIDPIGAQVPTELSNDSWPLIEVMKAEEWIDFERIEIQKPITLPERYWKDSKPSPLYGWFNHSWPVEHVNEFAIKSDNKRIPYDDIVSHLEGRLKQKTIEPVFVFATEKLANEAGGGSPGLPEPGKLWHELGTTEMMLLELWTGYHHLKAFQRHCPEWPRIYQYPNIVPNITCGFINSVFATWRNEHWLLAKKMSVNGYYPDAAIVDEGQILVAAEFGGRYDRRRLREIFEPCMAAGVPIFLW